MKEENNDRRTFVPLDIVRASLSVFVKSDIDISWLCRDKSCATLSQDTLPSNGKSGFFSNITPEEGI